MHAVPDKIRNNIFELHLFLREAMRRRVKNAPPYIHSMRSKRGGGGQFSSIALQINRAIAARAMQRKSRFYS